MPLETATYVPDLVATNPADTDNESQGAAHLRLIKNCLKNSFPNLGDVAVAATAAQLNAIQSATVGSGTTLSVQGINGGIPMGTMHIFVRDPGTSLVARGGTATGTEQYILLDGATYAQSKFSNLGASAFVTVSAPNFTVDNLLDTNRFIRAGSASTVTPGTKQANQNVSHNHSLTDPSHNHVDLGHGHTVSDPGHSHTSPDGHNFLTDNAAGSTKATNSADAPSGSAGANTQASTTGVTVNGGNANIAGNTTGITLAASGGAEARPEAYAAFICIKT